MNWTILSVILTLVCLCSSRYASRRKENTGFQPSHLVPFKNDEDIVTYLREKERDIKLWRCSNGVTIEIRSNKLPQAFELRCEILGEVKSIEFKHESEVLQTGHRKYSLMALPMQADGHYMSKWLLYSLTVKNPELSDQGVYSIKVTGASGITEQQLMFVSMKPVKAEFKGLHKNRESKLKFGKKLTKKERREKRKRDRKKRKQKNKRRRKDKSWITFYL